MKLVVLLTFVEILCAVPLPPQVPVPPQVPPVRKVETCICSERCDCKTKGRECPGQCPLTAEPLVTSPLGYPPAPRGYQWWRDPRGPGGWGLRQVSPNAVQLDCPDGKCPNRLIIKK